MTDNIIPLRGVTLTSHSAPATEAATSAEPVTDLAIDPERAQLVMSLVEAADFLLKNKDNVRYFVMGVGLNPPSDNLDVAFHVHTSPITVADFALSLKLLDKALTEGL